MPVASPLKLFFDGGHRPRAGGMETAVVLRGRVYLRRDLGAGSSMEAEWLALLHALELARGEELAHVVLLGDAAAVVGQANGIGRCRGAHRRHCEAFRALAPAERPRVRLVKRGQNLAGIALARLHDR